MHLGNEGAVLNGMESRHPRSVHQAINLSRISPVA